MLAAQGLHYRDSSNRHFLPGLRASLEQFTAPRRGQGAQRSGRRWRRGGWSKIPGGADDHQT